MMLERFRLFVERGLCALYGHEQFYIPKLSTADRDAITPRVYCCCGADCSEWFKVERLAGTIRITNLSDIETKFVTMNDAIDIQPGETITFYDGMFLR